MPDVGIVISARDNYSTVLTKMCTVNRSFNKDLDGMQQKLDHLNSTKAAVKVDVDKAKKELKELQKEFDKTGDAALGEKLKQATQEYDEMAQNLKLVEKNAKQAASEMTKLTDEASKASNRVGGSGGGGILDGSSSSQGILSMLSSAGAFKMLGDLASEAVGIYVNSAFGEAAGTMASSILSGGASGAALGSMIAPGVGTAIGAAAGGLAGALNGSMAIFEKKDDAFKAYVEESYNTVQQGKVDSLSNGRVLAGSRETSQIAFTTLFGGDEGLAKSYLSDVKTMANVTPFQFEDLTSLSKTLRTFKYGVDELIPQMTVIGDAGAALGMNQSDMNMVATALGRMKSSGKATLEYLNILQDRGIDGIGYLAQGYGMSQGEVYDAISRGRFNGEEAERVISDYLKNAYEGAMEKLSHTYEGLSSTLLGLQNDVDAAMGTGYTEGRKGGIQEQIDWLGGEAGERLKKSYEMDGEVQAILENKKEEIYRDVVGSVLGGQLVSTDLWDKYDQEAVERISEMAARFQELLNKEVSGALTDKEKIEMSTLRQEAEAMAANLFNGSDEQQAVIESCEGLAEAIQNDAALDKKFYDAGYRMGQQLSKGIESAISSGKGVIDDAIKTNLSGNIPTVPVGSDEEYVDPMFAGMNSAKSNAFGLPYVPYDNYLALLHQGERVLTASEARGYQNAPAININGNFTIREEADIEKITGELAHKIMMANMVS